MTKFNCFKWNCYTMYTDRAVNANSFAKKTHKKIPTNYEVMQVESHTGQFSQPKKLHCYKQRYNSQCYIYIPQCNIL